MLKRFVLGLATHPVVRVGALAAVIGAAYVASSPVRAADIFAPAAPETGADIPAASVKFGMRPYADNTFYVIAMKKGWFKDVGITILPEPDGLKVTDTNVTALLLNGQLDVSSEYCPLMIPVYKTSNKLKCIALTDNFLGEAILANPTLKLKGFADYIKDGMKFDDAIKEAMKPLNGKTLVGAPQLSDRAFEEAVSQFSGAKWKLEVLDDSKALVMAKAGQVDFVNPEGAPIVYTLMQAGWTVLINNGNLYEYGPGGLDSPIEKLVSIVGIGSNADYVSGHANTVLRFLSVVWRTIDAVGKDPSLFAIQAPYLNSVAGTSLDAAGVEQTIKILDPLSPFEYGANYFAKTDNALYYKNAWAAIIKDFEGHGVIPAGAVSPDEFMWGAAIWTQMKNYQEKSAAMIKDLDGKGLTADKADKLAKAKQFYGWYDYLDAYRLAMAASAS